MDKSSYLLKNYRKKHSFSYQVMDKHSSSDSNISVDSLEKGFKQKVNLKQDSNDENVETILVPFYENDVLIRIPKGHQNQSKNVVKSHKVNEKGKKVSDQMNYLVNKDKQKHKRFSYLEIFRKQFAPQHIDDKLNENEIRSLSPEFGDTERESFDDDLTNPVTEFCNTEVYNEIYYARLLDRDIEDHMNNSFEREVKFIDDFNLESPSNCDLDPIANLDNLRSVSDVSNTRRRRRRTSVGPIQEVKLGGLGPDMEKIKPRLERARSLQRYSEKVRIENRLKIYKRSNQNDNKQVEKNGTDKRQCSIERKQHEATVTYLVNKTMYDVNNNKGRSGNQKPKSAYEQRTKPKTDSRDQYPKQGSASKNKTNTKKDANYRTDHHVRGENVNENKSGNSKRLCSESKPKSNMDDEKVPPVHISFMVNFGRVTPLNTLQTLEKKHRMYQEQVKAFMNNSNV